MANGELMLALAKKRHIKFQIVMEQAGDKVGAEVFMGKMLGGKKKGADGEENKAEGAPEADEPELDKDGNPKPKKKSLKQKLIKVRRWRLYYFTLPLLRFFKINNNILTRPSLSLSPLRRAWPTTRR